MRADSDAASPHLLVDGTPTVTPDWLLVGAAPAGSLMTPADDAARWLLLQLGAGSADLADAVRVPHEAAIPMPAGVSPFPGLDPDSYALGWLLGRYRGMRLLWHSGGIDGFATQTFVLPEQQVGVTVSANLHGSILSLAAALELLDALAGTPGEQSWNDVLAPLAAVSVPPPPTPSPEGAVAPRAIEDLVGTYRQPGYGDLVVLPDADGLRVRLGESDPSAHHADGDAWEMRYDVLDAPYALTFEADAGRVVAATAPLDPPSGPTRFVRS